MRQSQLFSKTRKEAPKDEVAKNAQLLIRAGYIHKEMAGVYDLLPLGLRVFEKIVGVIREEMNAIGGIELHLSALQNPELWKKTDRWDDTKVDTWFKSQLRAGGEVGLGFTHEEPITSLMREHINSYRDLPIFAYQFQNKFRNEERAKSGLMRTREFVMKDLYSFSKDVDEHTKFYDACAEAYMRIFKRVGLGDKTHKTYASGGSFSTSYSYEFQTICDAGEDTIYIRTHDNFAVNKEIYDEFKNEGEFTEFKAVEVGNIFSLGTRFSEELGLTYKDVDGSQKPVVMGSYGIGPARLMATVAEVLSDEKGLCWPRSIAPFVIHLITLGEEEEVKNEAQELYRELSANGAEVLWDDRDARAGEKFADSDLLGIPLRVIVSQKTLSEGKYECVDRKSGTTSHKTLNELLSLTHA